MHPGKSLTHAAAKSLITKQERTSSWVWQLKGGSSLYCSLPWLLLWAREFAEILKKGSWNPRSISLSRKCHPTPFTFKRKALFPKTMEITDRILKANLIFSSIAFSLDNTQVNFMRLFPIDNIEHGILTPAILSLRFIKTAEKASCEVGILTLIEEVAGTMVLRPKACIIFYSPASGAIIHLVPGKLFCFCFLLLQHWLPPFKEFDVVLGVVGLCFFFFLLYLAR